MSKEDVDRKKVQWENFKKNKLSLDDFSKINTKIINDFLHDFELGINTPPSSKGARTPGTLMKLRGICVFLNKHLQKDFNKITKKDLHKLFNDMAAEKILKENKTPYRDTGDFVKNIKTFWQWMLKTKQVEENITEDLSRASYKKGKPAWTYLTHNEMKKLIDNARGDYRALILFAYDSGIRPQELYRIKVSDIEFRGNETLLNIPDKREDGTKVSKTFERTIKLKQSSELIKNYVEIQNLQSDDYLVIPSMFAFNKYLRELSQRLFGERLTKARGYTNKLRLYDIRHMAAIYWLDRYKTHSDLMYRFGWSKEDKIFYYSEFLGRRDKIDDDDMLTKEDKTKYEKELNELKKALVDSVASKEVAELRQNLMFKMMSGEITQESFKEEWNIIESKLKNPQFLNEVKNGIL